MTCALGFIGGPFG